MATAAPAARIFQIDISWPARALSILRLTDYMLVMGCGVTAIGMLASLATSTEGDAMAWWVGVPLATLLGYAGYTGWRHVGTIDPRVWRTYLVVFTLLVLVGTLLGASLWASEPSSEAEQKNRFVSLFLIVWMILLTVPALVSVLVLRGSRVSPFGIRLEALVNQVRERGRAPLEAGLRVPRIDPRRGALFLGIAICVVALEVALPTPSDPKLASSVDRVYPQLTLLACFLLFRARRYFQIDADVLLKFDLRPPVLFLRSFDDDEKLSFSRADKALLDFSLETRLANHFHRHGPFIAIGSPKEKVPQVGAARVLLPDDQWQERVLGWMHGAALVVMYAGRTPWVNWELARVIEKPGATRLLLLVPEIKGWRKARRQDELRARYGQLREAFAGTPWHEELMAWDDVAGLRAMLFNADGSMVMIRSNSRSRDSYHLAALVAHYVLLTRVVLPEELSMRPARVQP